MTKIISFTVSDILKASRGALLFGDADHVFPVISIDSRKISTDALFVAIKGETHDGHKFASDVVNSGIKGLIIDKSQTCNLPLDQWKEKGITCIAVDNTIKALGDIANFHRKRLNAKIVAITGSNGKTTTREMTASVVSQRFNTLTPEKNFNNEIGVPLTLFNLKPSHDCAIIELGMNQSGEIRRLSEICEPDIGIITNIGPAHIGMLGSMDAIMQAKGEILENIRPDGIAVLNGDDPRVMEIGNLKLKARNLNRKVVFGLSEPADIRASSITEHDQRVSFHLVLPEETVLTDLPVPGSFMVSNALAAASVGYILGLTGKEIAQGLENFKPVQGRMNIRKTDKGFHLIDDTYNANLNSMKAALAALKSLKGKSRGIFVSGDMFELGEYAASMHRNLGELAAEYGVARLYAAGNFAKDVADGAVNKGMNPQNIFIGTKPEIIQDLINFLAPGDWILIKGSRGMRMEEIVEKVLKC